MKTFDENYKLLKDKYQDEYIHDFLVDKIRILVQNVIVFLESG